MSNEDDVLRQQGPGSGLSRRDALRRLGLFGAAAVVAPAVLAACGGDDDDDAGGGGGGATTTAAGGGAGGDVGTQLATLLGIDPAGKNGKGVAFALGFWAVTRRRPSSEQSPTIESSGLSAR